MSVPNLKNLIDDKVLLVLGAGGSIDYGFPDWEGLAQKIIERLDSVIANSTDDFDREMAKEWQGTLKSADFKKQTIDHVISSNYGNLVRRHWIVNILKDVIYESEKKDLESTPKDERWVERLSAKYMDLLRLAENQSSDSDILKLVDNFRVVSLNYDRSFAYYFFPNLVNYFHRANLKDRDFLMSQSNNLVGFFRTYQPHGSLGFFSVPRLPRIGNPITGITVVDGNKYSNLQSNSNGNTYGAKPSENNHIELVGESNMEGNYKNINNNLVPGTKNCLVIGLSEIGLLGCKIDWQKFDTVYYSGKKLPSGVKGNFKCLGLYANHIVDELCK